MPSTLPRPLRETDVSTLAHLPVYVADCFQKPVQVCRCLGDRSLTLSSQELLDDIRAFSLGLVELGLKRGDRVAIISESRPEWAIADLAVESAGAIAVPIYPTLSSGQVRYILNDSGTRFVVVSTGVQLEKIREIRQEVPDLQAAIVIDVKDQPADAASGGETALQVMTLAEVTSRGRAILTADPGAANRYLETIASIDRGDLATIIYTSGTTGEPKGVMLTHENILSNVRATRTILPVTADDVALSFLPLSHSFERTVFYLYLSAGVTIAFAESFETIGRDMLAVRPTFVTGVPRVYEKIQGRILNRAQEAPHLRRWIFNWAVRAGLARARAELEGRSVPLVVRLQQPLADRLVFSKIRAGTGGRLRLIVSGSAPLSRGVAEFFCAIGLPIIEGYGLTETAPVLTVNPPDAPRLGTVGKPIPGVEIRIAEDGEILARGPNVMKGYYNKPEATRSALEGGWFHTGDIGRFDADGYLTITDRKKELLVTSGGKKIAPAPIESRLKGDPLIAEALLIGERRKFPSALIVPDFAALAGRLRERGLPGGTREELVRRVDVVRLYENLVEQVNRDLAQFERIKRVVLLPTEFSVERGELTPTLKVRRKVVEDRWKEAIEKIYAEESVST